MGVVRLGVLGGTFDPIHIAHLVLAQEARWQLGLDRVLLVPAGQPWRKEDRRVSDFAKRAEMVALAAAESVFLEVSLLEGERPGPSYIVDTLRQLKSLHPESDLILILGQDALDDLKHWKDPKGIRKLAQLAVAKRTRGDTDADGEAPAVEDDYALIDMPRMDISSSMIRERVRLGQPWEMFVLPSVAAHVRREELYSG